MDQVKSYINETKIRDHYWKVKDLNDSCNLKDFYIFDLNTTPLNKTIINNIRVYSTVKHVNLLESSFFEDKTNFYYVEEAVNSRNLIERLKILNDVYCNEPQLIEEQIVYWFFQILLALSKLHENEILHKRISKGWIVFVRDEIKLCVNPVCTLLMNPTERVKIESNDVNFNAPELIDPGKISLKYDVWSMGWLLFHMTTLENPFDYLLEPGNFTKLSLPPQFSVGLRFLFKNMIEINPDKRLSCAQLLEDRIFYKYRYHFDKYLLNGNRFKLITINEQDTGRIRIKFPLQAFDLNEKRKIKLLKRHLKSTSGSFMKLMSKSDYIHPNIQMIETLFEEDEFLYSIEVPLTISLSMKLEMLLENKENNTLKVKQILTWFGNLCEAVDYLHSNNIIHANICAGMIGFDQNDAIKLRFNENSFIVRSLNEQVSVLDTSCLALNSPETNDPVNAVISTKYDVYCLGWLLYTMCKLKDVSYDLKTTKNFNQLKVIQELPPATYPTELNNMFKEMISIDWKKRPTLRCVLDCPCLIRPKKKADTQTIEKENTFSEKRYEKVNIITRDDMSISYLVMDAEENMKKKVLKMYDIKLFKTEYDVSEINILLDMSRNKPHPNIIIYNDLILKPKICLISEYYSDTLHRRLETLSRNGTVSRATSQSFDYIKQALEWLLQLANAVNHLHTLNIIHRDIRPRNIYLNKDNLKLSNFSFSKCVNEHVQKANKTELNVYSYMSPEMINLQSYNFETDIWSFGCVLYEVLELKKAFDGDDFTEIYRSIEYDEAPTISSTFADIMIFSKELLRRPPKMRPKARGLVHYFQSFSIY